MMLYCTFQLVTWSILQVTKKSFDLLHVNFSSVSWNWLLIYFGCGQIKRTALETVSNYVYIHGQFLHQPNCQGYFDSRCFDRETITEFLFNKKEFIEKKVKEHHPFPKFRQTTILHYKKTNKSHKRHLLCSFSPNKQ